MSRNGAFDALLALGKTLTPPGGATANDWGDTDRKWHDYTAAQLPALWQIETDTDYPKSDHGRLSKRLASVYWAIVHSVGADQSATPSKAAADFLDRVDAAFINPKIGPQTLNGNCYAAYIQGTIRRYFGDTDGIEIIAIPIIVEFP